MRLSADHLSLLPSLLLHHTFRHCDDGLYTHSRSIGQGQRFGNPTLVHFSGAIALRANSKTDHLKLVNIASFGHKRRGMSYAKPVRCGENIEAVLMSVEATPKKSVRRRSAELGVSQSSVHRILRHDLKMKPYHISVHQGLTLENALQRRTMCAWFLRHDQMSGEQFQTLNDLKSLV
ncbi:hypothetical protein RRG08_061915 [Elysia crispata]|uniref:HTH psq-type domain-containing protein n=1 Tax=Elysia crispata TaxID=231223 RepID=A0AAE1AU25_9GAST|nr:hypothetical protein RRG08_061915 [Elysia crispata]